MVPKNKVKQQTLSRQQSYKLAEGEKQLSTDRDDHQLIRMSVRNRTARGVRNRVLGAGLKSCKARKKSMRSKEEPGQDHKHWTIENWSKVIFSGESNFQPTPGRLMVRLRPGEAYKPVSHTHCEMWWRSGDDLGMLLLGWNWADWMNRAIYNITLEKRSLPSALTMFPNSEDWFFQQDNAPCHTGQ